MEFYSNEFLKKYMIKEAKKSTFENQVDFVLENGDKLYTSDWNTEQYIDSLYHKSYRPVYEFNKEVYSNFDFDNLEDNEKMLKIIGFLEV